MNASLRLMGWVFTLGALCTAVRAADDAGAGKLAAEFVHPPDSARMWTWWFWLGDKVDAQSLTADLEELKAKGMGGVTVYSLSGPGITDRGPGYLTPEWRELFKHTVREADRLGLGVSTMLCSGWNAGGPWIKPEQACKRHVFAQLAVKGPSHFKGPLPMPAVDQRFYRDVAIQAFPAPAVAEKPIDAALLNFKCGRDSLPAPGSSISAVCEAPLKPLTPVPESQTLRTADVIDLAAKCSAAGELEWDVPEGNWVVLRTGCTLTGQATSWSSPTGVGLEADPFDAQAMDFQFQQTAAVLAQDVGTLTGKTFKSVQIDSWEINCPNWTTKLLDEFKRQRGYDARTYLPALAGYAVGSAEITDRFLYDYRKTLGDLIAENYFGRLTQLAEGKGLFQQSEAGGVCCPRWAALDALKNLGRCAIPMGEFWQDGTWTEANQNQNGKQTASAAHVYGKRIAAAEALTSFIHWTDSPATLKPTIDRALCEGFNHLFIFSSATRSGEGLPGTEFCAGTHFNRKITWWNQSRPFCDYVARCSHLLQQGLFVADVLYYNGDGCPNFVPPKHVDPSLGPGYDYDVCNTEVLLTRLNVKDGRLVLPDGMSYRMLALPDRAQMPVAVLQKILQLVQDGATVVGRKPASDPGLENYPACDETVRTMAGELWGDVDGTAKTEHAFGRGRVIWGRTLRQILADAGVSPDFTCAGTKGTFIDFIHRSSGTAEIYFLANRLNRDEVTTCSFRVTGKQPELWDPVSGTQRKLTDYREEDGQVSLPLRFAAHQSMFIIFRAAVEVQPTQRANVPVFISAGEIAGPWNVAFDPTLGGPETATFDRLEDWTKRAEDGIRYYSGKATYRTTFDLPQGLKPTDALRLDLGRVGVVAAVRLNGHDLGIVWTAPWTVDIAGVVKATGNALEIDVVNRWPNRLIGDAKLPKEQRRTATNIQIKPDAPLLESGLLGPIRILYPRQTTLLSAMAKNVKTSGRWKGAYGKTAVWLASEDEVVNPKAGFQMELSGLQRHVWKESDATDTRLPVAAEEGGAPSAACWYSEGTGTITIRPPDGKPFAVAIYVVDYDRHQGGRTMRIAIGDREAILSADETAAGVYVNCTAKGPVCIELTPTNGNAVVSAVFVDPVP